jgi:peptidoglycan hydrolase CwlO-like protein
MIQEESANEIYEDEDINIDNLHEELDKFTNNINELKNSVGAGLKP